MIAVGLSSRVIPIGTGTKRHAKESVPRVLAFTMFTLLLVTLSHLCADEELSDL